MTGPLQSDKVPWRIWDDTKPGSRHLELELERGQAMPAALPRGQPDLWAWQALKPSRRGEDESKREVVG